MATNAQFKLPRSVKRIASTILDPHQRRIFLNAMIDAELSEISARSRKFSDPAVSQKPNRSKPADTQET